jgi:hypothetical protein
LFKSCTGGGFQKKAVQTDSNQIKENGGLFGALILWGTRKNPGACFVVKIERVFKKLKTMWYERKQKLSILFYLRKYKVGNDGNSIVCQGNYRLFKR